MFPDSHPEPNTLEISLFGNGNGECIVVHLGDNQWMIVDSFCPKELSEPIGLAYLKGLGVDVATNVKLLVATHWHDDHVKGFSEYVNQCLSAELVISSALECDEFYSLMTLFGDDTASFAKSKSGIIELTESLTKILSRKKNNNNYIPPVRTQSDHIIYNSNGCKVTSFSPSPESIQKSQEQLSIIWSTLEKEANTTSGPRPSRKAIPCPPRNHNAIALWINFNDRTVLLGSDLEEENNSTTGWQAVLKCKSLPDVKSKVFKIAHHGSPNGHHNPIWDDLLDSSDPCAILTAYNKGPKPRPSTEDIVRIKGKTKKIYYTSLPKDTAHKYPRVVLQTLQSTGTQIRAIESKVGHIQIRWDSSNNISVKTNGGAGQI